MNIKKEKRGIEKRKEAEKKERENRDSKKIFFLVEERDQLQFLFQHKPSQLVFQLEYLISFPIVIFKE